MGFAEDWVAAQQGGSRQQALRPGDVGYTGIGMGESGAAPNASFGYMPWQIGGGSNSAPVYNSPTAPVQSQSMPFSGVGGNSGVPAGTPQALQSSPNPAQSQPTMYAGGSRTFDETPDNRGQIAQLLAYQNNVGLSPGGGAARPLPNYQFGGGANGSSRVAQPTSDAWRFLMRT